MTKHSMFPSTLLRTSFIGVDLGDKYSYLAILDGDGELIKEARLPSTPSAFQRKFRQLHPSCVALEVGSHSRWSSQVIQQHGHEVLVANARKLRAIYTNPRKNDRADAIRIVRYYQRRNFAAYLSHRKGRLERLSANLALEH